MLKVPQWKYNEFLLTGLIRCPKGVALAGASGHGRSGDKYSYYRHQRKCSCHVTSIPGDDIEKVVIRKLKEAAASEDVVRHLVEKANADFKKAQPDYREEIVSARRRLEGVVSQLDRVTDEILAAQSAANRKLWTDKSHRLQTEKEQIDRELQTLEKARLGT